MTGLLIIQSNFFFSVELVLCKYLPTSHLIKFHPFLLGKCYQSLETWWSSYVSWTYNLKSQKLDGASLVLSLQLRTIRSEGSLFTKVMGATQVVELQSPVAKSSVLFILDVFGPILFSLFSETLEHLFLWFILVMSALPRSNINMLSYNTYMRYEVTHTRHKEIISQPHGFIIIQ